MDHSTILDTSSSSQALTVIAEFPAFRKEAQLELFYLQSAPFLYKHDDSGELLYKTIELQSNFVGISRTDQRYQMINSVFLRQIGPGKFLNTRPLALRFHNQSPICESSLAFGEDSTKHLCLLRAVGTYYVEPQ